MTTNTNPGIINEAKACAREAIDSANATYACVNYGEAYAHEPFGNRSIMIGADIDLVLDKLIERAARTRIRGRMDGVPPVRDRTIATGGPPKNMLIG